MADNALPHVSVDALVASALPAWLTSADPDLLSTFHRALELEQLSCEAVKVRLKTLPGLQTFARPLLQEALRAMGLGEVNVDTARVVVHDRLAMPSAAPRLHTPMKVIYSNESLLMAALHNFHESETHPGLHRRAQLQKADGTVLPLSFEAFARLCRQLDLGGRYQQQLHTCLFPKARPPAPADFGQRAVEQIFEERLRAALDVAVRMARLKGQLTDQDYLTLLPLIARKPTVPAVAQMFQAFELFVLGKRVQRCLVIELRAAANGPVHGLISWFSNDPAEPIGRHANWTGLYEHLGMRLRERRYTQYFAGLIAQRERPAFLAQLAQLNKSSTGPTPLALDGRHFAIEGSVFACLRKRLLDAMIDDARVLAVPTGDLTQLERHERIDALKGAGLDALTLAALFVPGLGEVLFVAAAVDVVREVYDGYETWQIGDRQQALAHVFNVAQVVATGALLGAAQPLFGGALERIGLVDGLTPVMAGNRGLRLKKMPASAHYLEHPGELIRSFGADLEQVSDVDADALVHITGLTPEHLRSLRVHEEPAPARFREAQARHLLYGQGPTSELLVEQALTHSVGEPGVGVDTLTRDFTGLSVPLAQEIVECATTEQLETLMSGKVPLPLAERARWAVRESRIDRALLGFEHEQATNLDTLRLALALIDETSPWPVSMRIEVRLGEAQGKLVASHGPVDAQRTEVIVQTSGGYQLQARSIQAVDQGLLACLLQTLDETQKTAFGGSSVTAVELAENLLHRAAVDRGKTAQSLGMVALGGRFNPPRRLQDGRIGYPLSGRGESSRQALRRGIHRIYPTLTESQMDAYLEQLTERDVNLWDHLSDLEGRLARLRESLASWESQRNGFIDGLRRRRVATQIRRAWRRKTVGSGNDEYVLRIQGEQVGTLPDLPDDIDFNHVRQLSLRNLALINVSDNFLKRFPHLQVLDLRGNQLTQLPTGLSDLEQLRVLRFDDNRIVLRPDSDTALTRLTHLEYISLSGNPIGRIPNLSPLRHLRTISLRNTGLLNIPQRHQLLWRGLMDIRENQIREVNEHLQMLGEHIQQMSLHDNPLDEASQQALATANEGSLAPRTHAQVSIDDELRDSWIGPAKPDIRHRYEGIWNALLDDEGSADLFRFLADFAESDDFHERPPYYRARIWRILELCAESTNVRESVYLQTQGPQTCEDRLLLLLSQLEVRTLIAVHTAGASAGQTERELLRLGRSLYRLDQVDSIAARHIERMRRDPYARVDDIEVYLAYRVNLANRLGLPAQPTYMNYPEFSDVSSRQIRLAGERVLAGESLDVLAAALAQREFWQSFVRSHYRERFEALAAPFHQRLETAERTVGEHGEQVYLQQAAALKAELDAHEQALYHELAVEAYSRL